MNSSSDISKKELLVRQTLERVADKWTLLVIDTLEDKKMRFSTIQKEIGNISQKMLTQTLRQLERDGLVIRTVHPTAPPKVDYKLTPLGYNLGEAVCGIWDWVEKNLDTIEIARKEFDQKKS